MASTRPSSASCARLFHVGALAIALFSIAGFVPRAHARPVEGLPYITDVQIVGEQPCDTCPPQVCPQRPIVVRISGTRVEGCVHFKGLQVFPGRGSPVPLVVADFVVDSCGTPCPAVIATFTDSVTIPGLPPGPKTLWVESHVWSCADTSVVARTGARPFAFDVLGTCGDVPPVDSLLRSFLAFKVKPDPPCNGDIVSIEMSKAGCPPCLHFESFGLDSASALTATMDWRVACRELVCFPQSLTAPLGQFAAGHYLVGVNVHVSVLDTDVPDSTVSFRVDLPFDVAQTCDSTQAGCVSPELFAATGSVGCAIQLAPGGEGALTLYTRTPVPLGGLQGEIFCPPPFRVTGVFPPDLPGIQVSWVPEGERGARYVVFTTGEPIGPRTSPVLKLALAADTGSTPGTLVALHPTVRLASDPSGTAVPVCEIATNIRLAGTPLCVGGGAEVCDVNHDGHPDVLDLVSMTTCLRVDLPPGGSDLCPDCNASGSWEFNDLFCCAQRILRLPIVPRDSVGDASFVTIEEIERDDVGADLRIRLSGAERLGAAMLRLRYPAERWQAIDMRIVALGSRTAPHSSATAGEGWLPIVDTELPGVLQLGSLRIAADASPDVEFLIRFVPIGTPHDDDELVVEGADLASSDGSAFTIASLPRFTIPPPTSSPISRIELGPARPNPSTSATHFTVSLPQATHVELSMHDLLGRRVATLLSGNLPAGRQDATWNAGSARDGVYFARLVVNGRVFTQRVALLRDRH